MKASKRRKGFTLPEVLVTIAIVAILAAVLLPALNSQIGKGEASRAANDLLAIQTAASTFVSDVRRYPGNLVHLTTAISGSLIDINSTTYPTVLANKWKGPYLAKELIGGNLTTGFGAAILGTMSRATYNGIDYVSVSVTPITLADFNRVDEILDETVSTTSGQFRYTAAGSGTASFYALPVQ